MIPAADDGESTASACLRQLWSSRSRCWLRRSTTVPLLVLEPVPKAEIAMRGQVWRRTAPQLSIVRKRISMLPRAEAANASLREWSIVEELKHRSRPVIRVPFICVGPILA